MSTTKRVYTREFKQEAVRLKETSEKSTVEIENDLGIAHEAVVEQVETAISGRRDRSLSRAGTPNHQRGGIETTAPRERSVAPGARHLKKSAGHLHAEPTTKYQFIPDHPTDFEVTVMCRMLGVSGSGFYAWRDRPDSPPKMANDRLWPQIEAVYQRSRQTYGSLRIQAELEGQKVVCGHKRVARLMR